MPSTPLSLHKCWPSHTHTDISLQREQKYLLRNRSNCRYRNRAQIARPVLEVGLTVAIATSEESSLPMRIATLSVSLSFAGEEVTPSTRSQLIANECHARSILLRLCRLCHPNIFAANRRY
jgi:hypothetical protein